MTTRTNRRATTDGRPVRANCIFDVRVLSDGFGISRTEPLYYRRNFARGDAPFTGPASAIWTFINGQFDRNLDYYTKACICGASPAHHIGHTQQCADEHGRS